MTIAKHKVQFSSVRRVKKTEVANATDAVATTRIPRITKMMALAIRFDHLIKTGQVKDQAELARLAHVSRAKLTQVMDLLLLAPDIQEAIVSTSLAQACRKKLNIQLMCKFSNWTQQRMYLESLLIKGLSTVSGSGELAISSPSTEDI